METIFLFSASFSPYPQFLHGCYGNSPIIVKTWSKGMWKNGSNCSQRRWFIIDTQCPDINPINLFFLLVSLYCCLWMREKKMCFHHRCSMCAQLSWAFSMVVQPRCVCCRYCSCIHTLQVLQVLLHLGFSPRWKPHTPDFFRGSQISQLNLT